MDKKSFQLRMDDAERRELKAFCAQHGVSMQEFVAKAVEEYRKKWVV